MSDPCHPEARPRIRIGDGVAHLDRLLAELTAGGTFRFPALANGLFPASPVGPDAEYTGYKYVWVRDNVYVALAHFLTGSADVAWRNLNTLADYFLRHRRRFEDIIAGTADPAEPMNRPQIRFDGETLAEIDVKWAHAQNDALGYFVWLFCRIHLSEVRAPSAAARQLLTLFVEYWDRIRFWEDEDSGHWEETRKIEASSIGVVVAALGELRKLWAWDPTGYSAGSGSLTPPLFERLIARGTERLAAILPSECVQPDPAKRRRYDAALLFLIFPLAIVGAAEADAIIANVTGHLQGAHGIRRYLGDSFWSADYKARLRPEQRTADFSDAIAERDRLVRPGEEAQWCLFDPMLSIIHGLRYRQSGDAGELSRQIEHFNRSLGQLTETGTPGQWRCPELYYLERGTYTVNDTVPLLWTQANLRMAFAFLRESLR
jgi:phosphorylase kinase alpha/beta subunit